MTIDVGEGLRDIQPPMGVRKVPPIEPTRLAYKRDPSDTQFHECLQENLRKRKENGATVLREIKYSFDQLYNKYGVQPNAVMITQDYISDVIAECFGEYQVFNMKPDKLLGMDVIPIVGKETVKVCIIDKEE